MRMINQVVVFCGSNEGKNPVYADHARKLGNILAMNSVELIYGGGKKGLMGIIADSVMEKGGIVRGVMPQILVDSERQHTEISELFVVGDMHVRKRKLYELANAAVILPGGLGTLDELFEIITWNQLSIHDKKVFLMNSAGFYQHLLSHLAFLEDEGFLYTSLSKAITIINEPEELESYLK